MREKYSHLEKLWETLFSEVREAVVLLDEQARVSCVNSSFEKLFGYREEEIKEKCLSDLLALQEQHDARDTFENKFIKGEAVEYDTRWLHVEGFKLEVYIRCIPVVVNGQLVGGYVIVSDIKQHKKYHELYSYSMMYDSLTRLYNREYFEKKLQEMDGEKAHPVGVVIIDVDNMKLINETLGYNTGSELLKNCAKVLKNCLRDKDIIARIGGDEFGIILPGANLDNTKKVSRRLLDKVAEHGRVNTEVPLNVSIGLSATFSPEQTLAAVFNEAENDLYRDQCREKTSSDTVSLLVNALAERDFINSGHAERMSVNSKFLAQKMGMDERQINDLILLSHIHDLGKVGIPEEVLFKPGHLDRGEWEHIKNHPLLGYQIASSSADLDHIADLILYHHERWDGKGYPYGLKGEEIPLECRMLAIVDAFDAMTNTRPYRAAFTVEEALEEIRRCAGTQFDPNLAEVFIDLIEEQRLGKKNENENEEDSKNEESEDGK